MPLKQQVYFKNIHWCDLNHGQPFWQSCCCCVKVDNNMYDNFATNVNLGQTVFTDQEVFKFKVRNKVDRKRPMPRAKCSKLTFFYHCE